MARAAATPLPRLSRVRSAVKTMADRLGPRMGVGLLAAVIVTVLFGVLASEVHEGETQHFDDALRITVYGIASPRATTVLHAITRSIKHRALILSAAYASVLVFGWPIFALCLLGIADQFINLRARTAQRRGPPAIT